MTLHHTSCLIRLRLNGRGSYHPFPYSVTCHVLPLTLPVCSCPLSKQTVTAQSRCCTRASAERERRRPPVGVWWGVVIAPCVPFSRCP